MKDTKRTVKGTCPACGYPVKLTITKHSDGCEVIEDVIYCRYCGRVDVSMIENNGELRT